MSKVTVRDMDFKGKIVIMRVDFNVPLDKKQGSITDDTRIKEAIPTIKYVLDAGANKLILMSHLGRPDGKVVDSLRMNPVAARLSQILGEDVEKLDDCVGDEIKKKIDASSKRVILLENLRFHGEEEKGDEKFAKQLASLADIYVNDAFGTAHRAHASTTIIAKFLPACLGLLIEKEVKYLSLALSPQKPYVVILGGAKVSDKIDVISSLMQRADKFLIGGAMAYTFLKSKGEDVGASRVEADKLDLARDILEKAESKKIKIILPVDHLVVDNLENPRVKNIVNNIPAGFLGVDIGPKTVELFIKELSDAKTVLWNGPVGIFEKADYAIGTKALAECLANLKQAMVIVGGGDSASAAKKFQVADKLSHVSTGGGASLEFLEGKALPGIAIIPDKK
ncbi:MAG: phosphoglycerate kinase [Candidatus Omnitrophica bacterium]|jgi:3-phosphoglycerate kinase|nr:phosphoglycerate kinase [Candidatus Omnitrophota bacterium]